jgi:DNA mismatch endonuclease Vsr
MAEESTNRDAYKRSAAEISAIMRRVRARDTNPEVLLRRALWKRGIRYRLGGMGLPGKPDIVIARARLAIFVDGDYWHGNQWRLRGHNSVEAQLDRNPRKRRGDRRLTATGHTCNAAVSYGVIVARAVTSWKGVTRTWLTP